MAPVPRSDRYASVRIEDFDRAVVDWFDRVVDAHVPGPGGRPRKVPVFYGEAERAVAARDRSGIRDNQGRLILPVISIRQTGIDTQNSMSALGITVPRLQVSKKVSDKTSLALAQAVQRPVSERRLRDTAVYEVTTLPYPFVGTGQYEVIFQAQYRTQLRAITEKVLASLEYFTVPSMVMKLRDPSRAPVRPDPRTSEAEPSDSAPFESREPLGDYYIVGFMDGDLADQSNAEEFTDEERIIQQTIGMRVPMYLQVDPEGMVPAVRRELTAFNISFGDERVVQVDDPEDLEIIFGPGGVRTP